MVFFKYILNTRNPKASLHFFKMFVFKKNKARPTAVNRALIYSFYLAMKTCLLLFQKMIYRFSEVLAQSFRDSSSFQKIRAVLY